MTSNIVASEILTPCTEKDGAAKKLVRHKIGCTRTIETAILVCEYLRATCASPHSIVHPDRIRYHFTDPTPQNGWWSADIIVDTYEPNEMLKMDNALTMMVRICRAFVAGRGEIWG